MALAGLLGILVLVIGVTSARAQVIPAPRQPDGALVASIPPSKQDEFYSERSSARRKNAPRIVFVPGILGSKIDECRADNSECINVWGTVGAVKRSNVDLSIKADRSYRTDVVDSMFFTDVYGGVLNHIRRKADAIASDRADDALVTVFHYDWRHSNGENAKLLKERLCKVRAGAGSSPIVIVSHSMGGLMTKVWAARHAKEECPNGKKPEIAQIVFVATPHLGSPKAIKALAEGYNILFDELTGLKRYLGYWERNYVLDAINQAGMSFASLYELLPIRTSEFCGQQKAALAKATVPVVGEDGKPVNLFDVATWRRYDLLRRIGAPHVRSSYYQHELAPRLRQAEQLLCEIADFDPATVADVVYLFGREKADRTYGWFQLRSGASDSIDKSTPIQGDGTVPVYSAQNLLVSTTRQTKEVQADHTSIINSETMLDLINDLYAKAIQRADLQTARADTQFASLVVAETVVTGDYLAVSLDPAAWSQGDDRFAIELNTKALAAAGYTAADLAQTASLKPNAVERAKLYAIAASSTSEPSQRLTLIADVARSSYEAKRFEDAIVNSMFVATAANAALQPSDPQSASLQRLASEVQGWAYLRKGDLARFNELATAYASRFAVTKDEFKEPASRVPSKSFLVHMPKDWLIDDSMRTTQVPRAQMHFQ